MPQETARSRRQKTETQQSIRRKLAVGGKLSSRRDNGRTGRLLVNLELMKAGYPPIDVKFSDRVAYYNAFDAYHVKHDLSAMEGLFAGYINARLDTYLKILE